MTAEIAILNKHAVTLASDSAVTAGDKVYHNANKIFALSKSKPVGVMFYGNGSYAGIPWETIVKEYRNKYKDIHFKKFHSYALHFIRFLRTNRSIQGMLLNDDELVSEYACKVANDLKRKIDALHNEIRSENDEAISEEKIYSRLETLVKNYFKSINDNLRLNIRFKIDRKFFFNKFKDIIDGVYRDFDLVALDIFEFFHLREEFELAVYNFATMRIYPFGRTGLVFAGFGDDDLYPSLDSYEIGMPILGNMQIYHEDKGSVSNTDDAFIFPFAQDDIMRQFINGVHPDLLHDIVSIHNSLWDEMQDKFISNFGIDARKIQNQETFRVLKEKTNDLFIEKIFEAIRSFWKPTTNSISFMTPSELANLAESLINITALNCHVKESSETVGGPTDVVLITKGDGFIWVKRKQYFKAELNPDYFRNR